MEKFEDKAFFLAFQKKAKSFLSIYVELINEISKPTRAFKVNDP